MAKKKEDEVAKEETEVIHDVPDFHYALSVFQDEAGTFKVVRMSFCKKKLIAFPDTVEILYETSDAYDAKDRFKIEVVNNDLI